MRHTRAGSRITIALCAASLGLAAPAGARQEVAGALPPRAEVEMPASLALPAGQDADEARALMRAGRHAEAAARLMRGFQSTGDDRLLYHAGLERAAADQHALALRCFQDLLGRGATYDASVRAHVERLAALERARTSPVRLRIVDGRNGQPLPPQVLARTEILARPSMGAPESASELKLFAYDGEPLRLDPGFWSIEIRPPGYLGAGLRRAVLQGSGEETWELAVRPQMISLTLQISPASRLRDAVLRMTPTDGSPAPAIERRVDRSEVTLMVPAGSWQVDVVGPRHEAHLPLVIGPQTRPVLVRMVRKAKERGAGLVRDEPFLVASSAIFMTALLTGAGLVLGGAVKDSRLRERNERLLQSALVDDATGDADGMPGLAQVEATYPTATYHRDIRRARTLETAGLVVIMGAVGAVIPAMTVSGRFRRRALFIELGIGAALLGGGAAWTPFALRQRDELLAPTDPTERRTESDLDRLNGSNLGSSLLLGTGIGLTTFSILALITQERLRRGGRRGHTHASPLAGPGLAGVSLSGRF